jgi:CheY-like chemotaxis protein
MDYASGKPTILLVEDDELVRLVVMLGLEDCGYDVLQAGTAERALELVGSEPEAPVEAVVTDINLGAGLDGLQLADRLHERWPGLGVVFVSGRIGQTDCRKPHPAERYLSKPFSMGDLGSVLNWMRARA